MHIADRFWKRYTAAAHAMQTGVAFLMSLREDDDTAPKHLRVGINSAMVEHAALLDVLEKKGIITADEFGEALADQMEAEAERYRKEVETATGGTNVTLM